MSIAHDYHVVDGSGTVTGLAYYELQQELGVVSEKYQKERYKLHTVIGRGEVAMLTYIHIQPWHIQWNLPYLGALEPPLSGRLGTTSLIWAPWNLPYLGALEPPPLSGRLGTSLIREPWNLR